MPTTRVIRGMEVWIFSTELLLFPTSNQRAWNQYWRKGRKIRYFLKLKTVLMKIHSTTAPIQRIDFQVDYQLPEQEHLKIYEIPLFSRKWGALKALPKCHQLNSQNFKNLDRNKEKLIIQFTHLFIPWQLWISFGWPKKMLKKFPKIKGCFSITSILAINY